MGKKFKSANRDSRSKSHGGGRNGVTLLSLSAEEEDVLIDLLQLLDGKQKQKVRRAEQGDDLGDVTKDEEGESRQRASFVRKLIRDERRSSRIQSASKTAVKVQRNSLVNASPTAPAQLTGIQSLLPRSKIARSPQVRLLVSCENKGGPAKLVVIDRSAPVEDVIQLARQKFNVGKKYCYLVTESKALATFDTDDIENEVAALLTQVLPVQVTVEYKKELLVDTPKVVVAAPAKSAMSSDEVRDDASESASSSSGDSDSDSSEGLTGGKYESCPPVWTFDAMAASTIELSTPRRDDPAESQRLKVALEEMQSRRAGSDVTLGRERLPIYASKQQLVDTVNASRVVVVSGETGSGKTTQLPAYILDDMIMRGEGSQAYIICTQPRRIAAVSVAERVAFERGEAVGETVGYQVRLNSRVSDATRIVFCTTGVLLRRLQRPDFLRMVSHVLVDEVHERQVDTDFLVAYLKAHIDQFPHLRVVLMSATLQESLFANYFQSPTVYVSGRTFPVQVHYLPEILSLVAQGQSVVAKERGKLKDSRFSKVSSVDRLKMHIGRGKEASTLKLPPFDAEIIAEVVIRIVQKFSKLSIVSATSTQQADTGDAVLVFLSGIQAIQKVERALRRRNMASMNASLFILHSSLPPEQQRRVFKRTVPGTWKIILSTNIAETSVTIDDVTHVVDCGLHKEMRYDSASNVSSLEEVAISKASARQRAGRAGRVRAGNAWRFYCEEFYDGPAMAEYAVPEIRRVPLEEVVLQVLLLRLGLPEAFLGGCIEPPPQENIRHSIHTLLEIKAILPQPSFPLTALGYHLAKLPVDVHLGKMLITGALLNCIEPVLTIAAVLSGKSIFTSPVNLREEATKAHRRFHTDKFSDHLAFATAYDKWRSVVESQGVGAGADFSRTNFLSQTALNEVHQLREHFRGYLRDAGFVATTAADEDDVEGGEEMVVCASDDEDGEESTGIVDRKLEVQTEVDNSEVVRCALMAGLYPRILRVARYSDSGKKTSGRQDMLPIHILQPDKKEVFIHPMSLTGRELPSVFDTENGKTKDAFIAYYTKVESSKLFIHDATSVPLPAVMLFGGSLAVSHSRDRIIVDGWIEVKASELHAVLYKRLQRELENMLIRKIENPKEDISFRQGVILDVLNRLL